MHMSKCIVCASVSEYASCESVCTTVKVRNPLDPFLRSLCRAFLDEKDLSSRISAYYKVSGRT